MRKLLECCRCPTSIINSLVPYTFQQAKEAVLKSDLQLLDSILKTNVELPEDQENLLIYSLSQGKQEVALFLIREYSHLFQFNRHNDKGDTVLMIAIFKKMHKAIKLLIDLCDPNACDFRRNTPFIAAAANGDIETLNLLREKSQCKMLVRNDDGQSALHRACYFGQMEAVQWLLKFTELKVREKDKRGNNALHLACQGANVPLTRYLMKKVKNSHKLLTPNYQEKTPLDVLMTTIKSVAPHFQEHLNLSHLKPVGNKPLQ